ncbi:MAG: outer membrane protein transport protein [Rikenellaceae bacterium]
MKRIILLAALAAAVVTNASAEGYQVNTLSAKQLGMAHTSVSQKLDAESVWFNPAAAAHQEQKFSVAAGFTGIAATATWESLDGTLSQESDNSLSTPLYLYLNYKLNDDLAIGLSLNTPYGSSMNWGNDGWAGAHLIQDISLQAYSAQPTISYKLFDGRLSVGAGLMISWGKVEMSKSLFPVSDLSNGTIAALTQTSSYATLGATPLASIDMDGRANLAVGVNVGLMYDICDKWSVGASYRSKMMMKVDAGDTAVNYYDDGTNTIEDLLSGGLSTMENGTFAAELPLPSTFSVGATYYPTEQWKISAEMQMVGWSTYQSLDFTFTEGENTYLNASPKDYSNTFIYRLGAEYLASEFLTARAGIYFDESPVSSLYFAPETPSMNKIGYTCGVSLMPFSCNRNFSIDLAYGYISPAKHDRYGSYSSLDALQGTAYSAYSTGATTYAAAAEAYAADPVASETYAAKAAAYTALAKEAASNIDNTFEGKYRAVAHTFSIGLSWGF